MEIEYRHQVGKRGDWAIIDRKHDVVYLQTCRFSRAAGFHVGNDCSPAPRQTQARRQRRRDVLHSRANRYALHTAVLAKVLIIEIDDCCGDGKTQPLAAATFAQHHCVYSDKIAIDIYQWTATVSWIEGRIGLDVHPGIVRIDDDASANRTLPHDSCCIAMSVILQGAVASNHDLHHRG